MAMISGSDGDDMLSQFVRADFDAKELIKAAVRKDTISDDLAQLRQGISVLENQLREQVVSHHGRLIEQVAQAKDLEALTDTVTDGVARLQTSLVSVRSSIREPFEVVKSKTVQLEHLQAAGEILRAVIRIRDLSDKLERHMAQGDVKGEAGAMKELALAAGDVKGEAGAMKELALAAGHLNEIRGIMSRADLEGIDELESRRAWLDSTDTQIRARATQALTDAVQMRQQQEIANALQMRQQQEIANALQAPPHYPRAVSRQRQEIANALLVFQALGALPEAVERAKREILKLFVFLALGALPEAVERAEREMLKLFVFLALGALPEAVERAEREMLKLARNAVATALDTSTLGDASDEKARGGRGKGPANATAAGAWKAELWTRMEALMDALAGKCRPVRPCPTSVSF
ncbi:Golgi transport complex subunit 5-domain-containing protein [Baffinella frigidus]|nr:Golgi transport complex subunit 5-domain-containing protein [Cryptophyta sp. CCMP2293]